MKNPLEISIKYRTIIFSLAVLGVIWGSAMYINAPRREDPEFTIRTCVVTAQWPGVDSVRMEELVTEPLERTIEEVDSVKKTYSTTTPGSTVIKVEMVDSVDDVEAACDKIRSQLKGLELPDGVTAPFVDSNFGDTSAMLLALYQVPRKGEKVIKDHYSMRTMEEFAEDIRDELKQIDNVAMVDIIGEDQEAIYIEPDAGAWSQINTSITNLKNKLNAKNVLVAGGTIDTGRERYNVDVEGDFNAVNEIKKTTILNSNGIPVSLEQLGLKVVRSYIDPPHVLTRLSTPDIKNKRCIVIDFTMRKKQNIVALGHEVRAAIKNWEKTILPPDVRISLVSDQPSVVTENIKIFTSNLLQAIIILVLVAWLLIGKRVAVIMGISIPVIVAISFGIVRIFDVQLEMMSIASLVISLGMLVDCSIEICDNVHRLQEEGLDRFKATVEGSKQVAIPILIGTLTTVFAFLPMLSVSGNAGEYIRSIPIVVSVTLAVSWIIAITFTVALTWLVLKPEKNETPPFTKMLNYIMNRKSEKYIETEDFRVYRIILNFSLKHRVKVLSFIVLLFLFSIALLIFGVISTDFIPAAGGKSFLVNVWLPEGTSIKETSKVTEKIENIINNTSAYKDSGNTHNRLDTMVSFVGQSGPRFKLSVVIEFPKSNYAQIIVNAKTAEDATYLVRHLPEIFAKEVTSARTNVKRIGYGPASKYPIMIRIKGEDYIVLKKYAGEVEKLLRGIPGAIDVHDTWGNLTTQIDIIPDEEKCAAAGVSRLSVANTLNAFFSGAYLTSFREGDHLIPVYFRLPFNERNNLKKLKELYIDGTSGKIPLLSIADIKPAMKPGRIEREKQKRNMEVVAQLADGFLANPVIIEAMPELERIKESMPAGYTIEIGGTYDDSKDAGSKIGKAMIIALVLIVLCLLVYFNSILKTLAVTMTLPLAFTGAFFGLLIMNQPLGFFAQLGLLSLFGIVVNGAIVLFDFIGMLIEEKRGSSKLGQNERFGGVTREEFIECVIKGSVLRVRPIALTTLTTTGGLLPLAFGGGPLFEPMAVVLIFGLLYSTILTLIVMPVMYTILVEKFNMRIDKTQNVE